MAPKWRLFYKKIKLRKKIAQWLPIFESSKEEV